MDKSCDNATTSNRRPTRSQNQAIYGGIDPELENKLAIVESVFDDGIKNGVNRAKMLPAFDDGYFAHAKPGPAGVPSPELPSDRCPLLDLPAELIDGILAYLSPLELTILSPTCRSLHLRALSDSIWLRMVQSNVPGPALTSPHPFDSYYDLYRSLETKWFLTKYKVWFCDRDLVGKMIVCRWNQQLGRIEGFQVLAISNNTTQQNWVANNDVVIHRFEPRVSLHTEKPVIEFVAGQEPRSRRGEALEKTRKGFQAEVPLVVDQNFQPLRSNFMLARPLQAHATEDVQYQGFPYDCVWPPPAIPARCRVAGLPSFCGSGRLTSSDVPTCRAEVTDQAFRIKRWIEMSSNPAAPEAMLGQGLVFLTEALTGRLPSPATPMGAVMPGLSGTRVEEEIITYATMDPAVYTPTELKPWRGIWVGDYSDHGCEFLLITQPDDPEATDEELGLVRGEDESDESWDRRRRDARIYRGRLEAVKLTGDPNVPRGEFTCVVDDLGEGGFDGYAQDEPFRGVRVVKSKGHIARMGFVADKYVESRLLLISGDRLAQYWVGFRHISFFERVDIDRFLYPE